MSRHTAWEAARVSLQKEADRYTDDYFTVYAVTVKAGRAGIDLGTASLCGIESWDSGIERDIEDVVLGDGLADDAVADAAENLSRLVSLTTQELTTA